MNQWNWWTSITWFLAHLGAVETVKTTQTYLHLAADKAVSKQFLIYTSSRHRATLSFIWSCVYGYLPLEQLTTALHTRAGCLCLSAIWCWAGSLRWDSKRFFCENYLLTSRNYADESVNVKVAGRKPERMTWKMLKKKSSIELIFSGLNTGSNNFYIIGSCFVFLLFLFFVPRANTL